MLHLKIQIDNKKTQIRCFMLLWNKNASCGNRQRDKMKYHHMITYPFMFCIMLPENCNFKKNIFEDRTSFDDIQKWEECTPTYHIAGD